MIWDCWSSQPSQENSEFDLNGTCTHSDAMQLRFLEKHPSPKEDLFEFAKNEMALEENMFSAFESAKVQSRATFYQEAEFQSRPTGRKQTHSLFFPSERRSESSEVRGPRRCARI